MTLSQMDPIQPSSGKIDKEYLVILKTLNLGQRKLSKVSKYWTYTYNTCACVLQIKRGVHLANRASKRHPKLLLTNTMIWGAIWRRSSWPDSCYCFIHRFNIIHKFVGTATKLEPIICDQLHIKMADCGEELKRLWMFVNLLGDLSFKLYYSCIMTQCMKVD